MSESIAGGGFDYKEHYEYLRKENKDNMILITKLKAEINELKQVKNLNIPTVGGQFKNRQTKTTTSKLWYFYCRDARRKNNFFIDKINFLVYCASFNFIKRNNMIYLKGTIIDNFQSERTTYRLIDFNLKDNMTTLENVIIFAKKYTRYVVDRKNGDNTSQIIKSELNQRFIESNKQEFDRDISGKKGEFGNTLTEE